MPHSAAIHAAAALIANAEQLLITAGAGMGVDSGLPDFRGNAGFWRAYPALQAWNMDFTTIANPQAFRNNARQAWGFYGHRLALYRKTQPHRGFQALKEFGLRMRYGTFVITSNVDGQFQKAGFAPEQMLEIHGSIHHLQCAKPCDEHIWSADAIHPRTDDSRCEWIAPDLPTCPQCGRLARPNILMFGDGDWIEQRAWQQQQRWHEWLEQPTQKMVVIELGAGTAIPSIRRLSETQGCPLIRVNPDQADLNGVPGVSLPLGAEAALLAIRDVLAALPKHSAVTS